MRARRIAGAYKGQNDDQLDKINVYFNEAGGGSKSVQIHPPIRE